MTCTVPKQEPSLSSRKLNPPLESRRVRTQASRTTCLPTASSRRAAATLILSMNCPPERGRDSLFAPLVSGRNCRRKRREKRLPTPYEYCPGRTPAIVHNNIFHLREVRRSAEESG